MSALNAKSNLSFFINFGFLILIIGAFLGTEFIGDKFKALQVKTAPNADDKVKVIDVKKLYPVVVPGKNHENSTVSEDVNIVDTVFKKAEEEKPKEKIVPVDYVAVIRGLVSLKGTGINGAFFNDHFFTIGQLVTPAFVNDGAVNIKPVLVAVGQNDATLMFNKQKIKFILKK